MIKIILEVENVNYLESDFHITYFLSILKGGGEKKELHFLPYSKQANILKLHYVVEFSISLFIRREWVHWNILVLA